MTNSAARLGVDIGGTFTDVVLEIAERQFSTKVLTTYSAPEVRLFRACIRCVLMPMSNPR